MEFQFKGYDWRELAPCWGIAEFQERQDAEYQNAIAGEVREYIHDALWTEREAKVAKELRAFIGKLAEQTHGFDGPIWKGMLEVGDDNTLLQFSEELLRMMWT